MSSNTKKISALALCLFIFAVMIYGSYLPFKKSSLFIRALNSLSQVKSLEELFGALSVPLDFHSPIGQEELVRNMSNSLISFINQNPSVAGQMIKYAESYYKPIVEKGRGGLSFGQNLYILGEMNELALVRTGDPQYFESAKKYFAQGVAISPKRPQFLYGLFDIYRAGKNVDGAKAAAEQILALWPEDQRTRDLLSEFLGKSLTEKK